MCVPTDELKRFVDRPLAVTGPERSIPTSSWQDALRDGSVVPQSSLLLRDTLNLTELGRPTRCPEPRQAGDRQSLLDGASFAAPRSSPRHGSLPHAR